MAEGGYYRCDGRDMLARRCVQGAESKWDRAFNAKKMLCTAQIANLLFGDSGRVPGRLVRARQYPTVV